jgi:hypothetical protein
MDLKNLLGKLTLIEGTMASAEKSPTGPKFTGQWKGTDAGTPGKKLVGDSVEPEESILKDLSRGPTPKTKEQELVEQFEEFLQALEEDSLGVEEKRPARKGSRPARVYTKTGEKSKRYTYNADIDEGKVVPVITAFRKGMEKIIASDMDPQAKQAAFEKLSAEFHKNAQTYADAVKARRKVTEVGTPVATGQTTMSATTQARGATPVAQPNPAELQAAKQATATLKAATGSKSPNLDTALNVASQGGAIDAKSSAALQPMMQDVATIAQDPKLAGQLKTVLSQAQQKQTQQAKQQAKQQTPTA